ncbi:siderophore ABC transporter substrate-binding protein [Anaerocolumna jejuensis]|uniref:siderophore ABC transporter substrate-binding protein n=1 Tax=Anaerocolumna jejuensis TaxID=259063 RepID=UPI003F7BBDF0
MKKLYLFALAIVMAGSILSGCSKSTSDSSSVTSTPSVSGDAVKSTISVTHELGTVEVPVNPQKIAVFDYSVLDTIDFLGMTPEIILPQNDLPKYLEKYKQAPYKNAGDLKEPNLEAINEFKPDLIIIGGRQADLYSEFSKIAPTVYTDVDYTKYWDDFEKTNLMVGEIFDKKSAVDNKLTEIKSKIDSVKATADKSNSNALIILTNDGSLSAYGSGSRFGIIHDLIGVKPVDSNIEASTHGMEIGFEYIAEKNPDILFVVDRTVVVGGTNLASKTLDNDLIKGTNAGKNAKIIYLEPGTWYLSGYGLESFPMMLEEISSAVQ